ncbi:hypothetical protein [Chryseobacterium gleum]|uniref:hypothetical protein n=1 Tax=Chryseobacterium gleum TaxID=250 RepID=UPI00241F221B|nr:hypothetical protein [Chryseobacterium gleum]
MEKELSFYQFTQLAKEEQYHLAFTQGEFIGTSEKGDIKFALYKVFNFYVEVVFDSEENKVVTISSFLKSN